MDKYVIRGGKPLFGDITISGAKNAVVAIIPAAILAEGVCRIENVPLVSDVLTELEILRELGVRADVVAPGVVEIDASRLHTHRAVSELNQKFRASYYLLGAFLSKFGKAEVSMPGGCNFGGARPIDQHIKGFEALGAEVFVEDGIIKAYTPNGKQGAHVYFDGVTVGGTVNVMLAAVLTPGLTVLENAAREPHIVDLANFLNYMGAEIMGAGTDIIRIKGVQKLHGCTYSIIPDQIEAGTFLAAAAAAGGSVTVRNVTPKHLEATLKTLQEAGAIITEGDDYVTLSRAGRILPTNIKASPYPGFPTDMQPQLAAVLTLADGVSVITDEVWDTRFKYAEHLERMGAQIEVQPRQAVITGVSSLSGAEMAACDLRAGAAMVIAALAARGESVITNIHYVERGYENIIQKLRQVGADIELVSE